MRMAKRSEGHGRAPRLLSSKSSSRSSKVMSYDWQLSSQGTRVEGGEGEISLTEILRSQVRFCMRSSIPLPQIGLDLITGIIKNLVFTIK